MPVCACCSFCCCCNGRISTRDAVVLIQQMALIYSSVPLSLGPLLSWWRCRWLGNHPWTAQDASLRVRAHPRVTAAAARVSSITWVPARDTATAPPPAGAAAVLGGANRGSDNDGASATDGASTGGGGGGGGGAGGEGGCSSGGRGGRERQRRQWGGQRWSLAYSARRWRRGTSQSRHICHRAGKCVVEVGGGV